MASWLTLAIALLVLSVSLSGCKRDKDGDPKGDVECNNSDHDGYRTLVVGSETREYILHVPSSYDSNTSTPLVINYHGFGDCASNFANSIGDTYDFNSTADANNFLVAYPQGAFREKGDRYWEPGDNGGQDIAVNDVYFTEQLIAEISSVYNIDVSRVYAVGYSNGGMMSYDLACTGSDFIAAIGIMSGISLSESCAATNVYTSVIHFHGIEDEVLPLNGNAYYQSVSDVLNSWLSHNNIPVSSRVTTNLNGGDVIRDEYTGGSENTAVVLYTINREFGKDGGHVWFSGDIDGTHPNQILWDFLSNYSLDD